MDLYTKIPNDVIEQLAKRSFNGTQMSILLIIIRNTYGWHRDCYGISLEDIEKATGIKKKRLSPAVNSLIDLKILNVYGEYSAHQKSRKLGININFEEWSALSWTVPQMRDGSPNEGRFPNIGIGQSPKSGTVTVPQIGDLLNKGLKKDINKDTTATSDTDSNVNFTDQSISDSGYHDIMSVHTKVFGPLMMPGLMIDYVRMLKDIGQSDEFIKELMLETGESSAKPSLRYMKIVGERWINEGITSREESATAKRNAGPLRNDESPRRTKAQQQIDALDQFIKEEKERGGNGDSPPI
jgi:phage replication O-like protein O